MAPSGPPARSPNPHSANSASSAGGRRSHVAPSLEVHTADRPSAKPTRRSRPPLSASLTSHPSIVVSDHPVRSADDHATTLHATCPLSSVSLVPPSTTKPFAYATT